MFMILVLIMVLLQLMIYYRHSQVFNGKELVSAIMFFSCNVLNVKPLNLFQLIIKKLTKNRIHEY